MRKIKSLKGPHLFEAELASQTILKQRTEVPYPGMTWDDSLGNIKVLDMWRKEIGYFGRIILCSTTQLMVLIKKYQN